MFLQKNTPWSVLLDLKKKIPKNTAKYGQQIEFKPKHCMFSSKVYPSPENLMQPLVAMVVTFCMSSGGGEESYQPLWRRQRKKGAVLLYASVKRFGVSRMQDFIFLLQNKFMKKWGVGQSVFFFFFLF